MYGSKDVFFKAKEDIKFRNLLDIENCYELLNISPDASPEEILSAYKKLMLIYHPDKYKGGEAFATKVSQKINKARDEALSKIEKNKDSYSDGFSDDALENFSKHIRNIIFRDVLNLSIKNLNLMHSAEAYGLGMVLGWVHCQLHQSLDSYLHQCKLGLASKPNTQEVIDLAQLVCSFIPEQFDEAIRARELDLFLTKSSKHKQQIISTINLAWNVEAHVLKELVDNYIILQPDIPFLIHNGTQNNPKFIGIIYQESQFYLFSPYRLLLNKQTNSLQKISYNELILELKNHFIPTRNRISGVEAETSNPCASIFICSFVRKPQALIEYKLEETQDGLTVVTQKDFLNQLFNHDQFNPIDGAKQILQSVCDCYIKNVLADAYLRLPAEFSFKLLDEFLQKAVQTEHLLLAEEICFINVQDKHMTEELCTAYINHYFNLVKKYNDLPVIVKNFRNKGIDLGEYINASLKTPESSVPEKVLCLLENKHILKIFLSLGFQLSTSKREQLISHLAEAIAKCAKDSEYTASSYQNEKIKKTLEQAVEKMQQLVDCGYSLHMSDNKPAKHYPLIALLEAKLFELANAWCEQNLFHFNAIDQEGKTALNHATRLKNWPMVNFLMQKNALYSSGPAIPYNEIPPLSLFFHPVEGFNNTWCMNEPALLLQLKSKEGDALSIAMYWRQLDKVDYLLELGFRNQLQANPTSYLYSCTNQKGVLLLLKELSLSELKDYEISKPIAPFNYRDGFIQEEIPINVNPAYQVETLLDLQCDEVDTILAAQPFPSLTKIMLKGAKSVFYSMNSKLSDILLLQFYPKLFQQQIDSVKQLVITTEAMHIPDLSFYINNLIQLDSLMKEKGSLIKEIKYEDSNPQFDLKSYINHWPLVSSMHQPLGIKVTYNDENKVCDFRFIDSLHLLDYSDFFLEASKYDMALGKQRNNVLLLVHRLNELKIIFEETLDKRFADILPYEYDNLYNILIEQQNNLCEVLRAFVYEQVLWSFPYN